MSTRFLHAADLHLDSPFSGLTASEPEVVTVLRDASLGAFDQLVRTAIARDVAFVVLAGNVYDGSERGVRAQLELHRGLSDLSDHGIRTVLVAGNHDPIDEGWSAVPEWPELVTFFPSDQVASVVVEVDGTTVATVHGISYGTRAVTENLVGRFVRPDDPGPHIAVLHAAVGDDADPAASPCSIEDLVATGMDYWALGHAHDAQILNRDPWIVYPGTTQARTATTAGQGAKGAYIVEIDDEGTVLEPEFVALDRVRFARVEHSIDGLSDVATLRDRLVDLGRRHLAEADGRSVLLRVELSGRGPIHGDLYRPGALVEVLDALRAESMSDTPFLWWDRIDLATRPVQDLEELQGRNDFVADLVDETAGLLTDDDARASRVEGWDDELPSDLAHLLSGSPPSAAAPERWRAAQELAVDLVSADES